jgi:hypothetical protein
MGQARQSIFDGLQKPADENWNPQSLLMFNGIEIDDSCPSMICFEAPAVEDLRFILASLRVNSSRDSSHLVGLPNGQRSLSPLAGEMLRSMLQMLLDRDSAERSCRP